MVLPHPARVSAAAGVGKPLLMLPLSSCSSFVFVASSRWCCCCLPMLLLMMMMMMMMLLLLLLLLPPPPPPPLRMLSCFTICGIRGGMVRNLRFLKTWDSS